LEPETFLATGQTGHNLVLNTCTPVPFPIPSIARSNGSCKLFQRTLARCSRHCKGWSRGSSGGRQGRGWWPRAEASCWSCTHRDALLGCYLRPLRSFLIIQLDMLVTLAHPQYKDLEHRPRLVTHSSLFVYTTTSTLILASWTWVLPLHYLQQQPHSTYLFALTFPHYGPSRAPSPP
jgi:hypothetical protein